MHKAELEEDLLPGFQLYPYRVPSRGNSLKPHRRLKASSILKNQTSKCFPCMMLRDLATDTEHTVWSTQGGIKTIGNEIGKRLLQDTKELGSENHSLTSTNYPVFAAKSSPAVQVTGIRKPTYCPACITFVYWLEHEKKYEH